MASHSSTFAWRIPMDRGRSRRGGYSPWSHKESDMTEHALSIGRKMSTPRSGERMANKKLCSVQKSDFTETHVRGAATEPVCV